jgi:thiamine-phosphate pyrophosphorylase
MIDASLNRAAEALRVAEDVARFHWNIEGFARDLKSLRHEVLAVTVAAGLAREEVLAARDVEGDVGRGIASPAGAIAGPGEAAFRNIERAKEALRSIEEAARVVAPDAAASVERLRYRLYALEKGLGRLSAGRGERADRLRGTRLCLLATRALAARPLEAVVSEALEGGAGMVEVREKGVADAEVLRTALALREVTARAGALLVVNDRPDIALLAHADGVHLGQGDLPVAAARSLVGEDLLIGVSTHSVEQARAAESAGADYIGAGPVHPTATKDAGPLLGLDGLRAVLQAVAIPAFAIGGISPANARDVARAGAGRAAVSSAILRAPDAAAAARAIRAALEGGTVAG